ncbi:MAG: hypothetical protein AAFO75_02310 [Pseudomonadota bacterium]
MSMSAKLIVGLLLLAGAAIAVMYLPSVKVGEEMATVVASQVRTDQHQRKHHRLEVRLDDGSTVSVAARSMTKLDDGASIKVEKRRSMIGKTFYVWDGTR